MPPGPEVTWVRKLMFAVCATRIYKVNRLHDRLVSLELFGAVPAREWELLRKKSGGARRLDSSIRYLVIFGHVQKSTDRRAKRRSRGYLLAVLSIFLLFHLIVRVGLVAYRMLTRVSTRSRFLLIQKGKLLFFNYEESSDYRDFSLSNYTFVIIISRYMAE